MKRFIQFGHGSPGFGAIYVYPDKDSSNDEMIGQISLHRGNVNVNLNTEDGVDAKLLQLISRNVAVFEQLMGASGARQWSITLEEEDG